MTIMGLSVTLILNFLMHVSSQKTSVHTNLHIFFVILGGCFVFDLFFEFLNGSTLGKMVKKELQLPSGFLTCNTEDHLCCSSESLMSCVMLLCGGYCNKSR